MVLYFVLLSRKIPATPAFKTGTWILAGGLAAQVLLGILTVINSTGIIPVGLGVMHQAGALFMLATIIFIKYQTSPDRL